MRGILINIVIALLVFIGVILITQHYIDLEPVGKEVAGSLIPNFNLGSDQIIEIVKKPVMSFKDNKYLVYAGIVILIMFILESTIVNRLWRYRAG